MQLPGLQDKSKDAAKRILWMEELAENCIVACVDNRGAASKWEKILMIFNCSATSCETVLPEGSWQLLADGENAFCWQKKQTVAPKVDVAAFSAMILGSK